MTTIDARATQDVQSELALGRAQVVRQGFVALTALLAFAFVVALIGGPRVSGLSRAAVVGLGITGIGLTGVGALAPWFRLLYVGRGEVLLGALVLAMVPWILTLHELSDAVRPVRLMLLAVPIVFSTLTQRVWASVGTILATLVTGGTVMVVDGSGDMPGLLVVSMTLIAVATLNALMTLRFRRLVEAQIRGRAAERQMTEMLLTVADATRSLTTLDTQAILETVARGTADLGNDIVGIYVVEGDRLRYAANVGVPEELEDFTVSTDYGLAGAVFQRDETVVVDNYFEHPIAMEEFRGLKLRSAIGTPIHASGNLVGILVAGTLAARRLDERQIAAYELLASQAGRALELSQRFEEQAQVMAELRDLDRLKGEFLANVSHELRTPLTVITGLSETLEVRWDSLDESSRLLLVDRIRTNADSLSRALTSLFDLVQLEGGHLDARREPFDLTALVRHVLGRMGHVLDGRPVTTRLDPDAEVVGDRDLIERVVENLVSNAARHTPPGTPIEVVVRRRAGRGAFRVVDEGPGIDPAEADRIADRFFRGRAATEMATRGLGIGLSLSAEILRLHDTRLDIDSSPGDGAAFSFALPLARTTAPRLAASHAGSA